MKLIYRLANINDLDRLFEIEKECFKQPYKKEDLQYEVTTNPINKYIVVEVDGLIIGFIDFMITFNSATINQIAVVKEYRRNGIGLCLLNQMEKFFPKDGEDAVEFVTLEVRESNLAALALYQKNQYEVITVKQHYYADGENAIYMVKRLSLCH